MTVATKTRIHRCEECGRALPPYAEHCVTHPTAPVIAWTHKIRDAYAIIVKAHGQLHISGKDLDRWVEEVPADYIPGTSRGNLALALSYARRWKIPPFSETDLPSVATAAGLFG